MDLQSEMLSAADDLKEQKGLQAQVVSFDGKVLKMLIPGLRIPQSQVEATVQTHLQKAVGEQKAAEIWSDPAGKGSMLAWGWHDALECNVTYTFTKTREENDPANNGTLGNAAFDVEVEYAPGNSGAVDFPKDDLITVHEFTYATAENTHDFSWNAMAKLRPAISGQSQSSEWPRARHRPWWSLKTSTRIPSKSETDFLLVQRRRINSAVSPAPGRGKPSVGRCGNGSFYLLINPTTACFREED